MTNKLMTVFALGVVCVLSACGDDSTTNDDLGTDMPASQFPTAPTIGSTQLDRMGRAGVNTALTDPFYTDKPTHDGKLDAYNKAAPSAWPGFAAQFAGSLAVLDGLDGICGNQPLYSAGMDGGAAGAYGTLAGILANDQLLLATTVSSCSGASNYLAVEVSVITSGTPASCGGRTPLDNTIDTTYAVLSGGAFSAVPVVNGVTAEADPTANAANLTTFPYLGAPL